MIGVDCWAFAGHPLVHSSPRVPGHLGRIPRRLIVIISVLFRIIRLVLFFLGILLSQPPPSSSPLS